MAGGKVPPPHIIDEAVRVLVDPVVRHLQIVRGDVREQIRMEPVRAPIDNCDPRRNDVGLVGRGPRIGQAHQIQPDLLVRQVGLVGHEATELGGEHFLDPFHPRVRVQGRQDPRPVGIRDAEARPASQLREETPGSGDADLAVNPSRSRVSSRAATGAVTAGTRRIPWSTSRLPTVPTTCSSTASVDPPGADASGAIRRR